jgi:hypothetical protein
LSQIEPQRRFLNCTAQGAAIQGFEEANLYQVAAGMPDLGEDTGLLRKAVPRLPVASAAVSLKRLTKVQKELENALHLLQEQGPGSLGQLPDSSGVLAQIRDNAQPGWGEGEYLKTMDSLCLVLKEIREGFHG